MVMSWKVKAGVLIVGGVALGVAMSNLGTASEVSRAPIEGFGQQQSGPVDIMLEDESGRPLSVFNHQGDRFVMGEEGSRYAVRVTNKSDKRVEAVVTVDGRDVVSGEPGEFGKRGYIIPARGSVVIDGFRRNLDTVAAFRFSTPERSYGALKGTPQNVGVIGVAVFDEADSFALAESGDSPGEWKQKRPASAAQEVPRAAPGRAGGEGRRWQPPPPEDRAAKKDNLGTGWGEDRTSRVSRDQFERKNPSRPSFVVSVRYDNRQGLQARGIQVFDTQGGFAEPPGPEAFPLSRR